MLYPLSYGGISVLIGRDVSMPLASWVSRRRSKGRVSLVFRFTWYARPATIKETADLAWRSLIESALQEGLRRREDVRLFPRTLGGR